MDLSKRIEKYGTIFMPKNHLRCENCGKATSKMEMNFQATYDLGICPKCYSASADNRVDYPYSYDPIKWAYNK